MSDEDDALLTTKQVAERYSVHVRTIPKLVKEGRIPGPVPGWAGGEHRWLKSEIVQHIRSLRKQELKEQLA